jgi:hypothetical protein
LLFSFTSQHSKSWLKKNLINNRVIYPWFVTRKSNQTLLWILYLCSEMSVSQTTIDYIYVAFIVIIIMSFHHSLLFTEFETGVIRNPLHTNKWRLSADKQTHLPNITICMRYKVILRTQKFKSSTKRKFKMIVHPRMFQV